MYVTVDISISVDLICYLGKMMCDHTFTDIIFKHAHTKICVQMMFFPFYFRFDSYEVNFDLF